MCQTLTDFTSLPQHTDRLMGGPILPADVSTPKGTNWNGTTGGTHTEYEGHETLEEASEKVDGESTFQESVRNMMLASEDRSMLNESFQGSLRNMVVSTGHARIRM
jgi:hypothetical protein